MKTYDTPGPLVLDLRIPAGELSVESGETGQTTVDLQPLNDAASDAIENAVIELRPRGAGHELVVETHDRRRSWGFGGSPEYRLTVRCPAGADLRTATASADLRARGRFGSADCRAASGEVDVEEITGLANVKTASGDVRIASAGALKLNTASGDARIDHAAGALQANLVSGDLKIGEALAAVSANTVSGDIVVDTVVEGTVNLHSVSGDVQVGVRKGSRIHVDATSMSGDLESELPLSDSAGSSTGPLVELRARTVSGDVEVGRSAAGPVQLER